MPVDALRGARTPSPGRRVIGRRHSPHWRRVGTPVKRACDRRGSRGRRCTGSAPGRPGTTAQAARAAAGPAAAALSAAERAGMLAALDCQRFADLRPRPRSWAMLLDEGSTCAQSAPSTGSWRCRRGPRAPRPGRPSRPVQPELLATGPDQCWTWDITKLHGPWRGLYFDLYVDARYLLPLAVRWDSAAAESAALAKNSSRRITCANRALRPAGYIHADNGTSMTSKTVAVPARRPGITRRHTRPHVSNDNPFSEAQFKTLKYRPDFPAQFPPSIETPGAFCDVFFPCYNNEHRHGGIWACTPRPHRPPRARRSHPGRASPGPDRRLSRSP